MSDDVSGSIEGLYRLAMGDASYQIGSSSSISEAIRSISNKIKALLEENAKAREQAASTKAELKEIQHADKAQQQASDLAAAEAEVKRLVREGAEDRRQMAAQMAELQRVMEQLKAEKEQYYFQSKQDKEVTEQILNDLQGAFQNIVDQREASLAHAQAHHDVLGEELFELRAALDKEKREKAILAEEIETENMTHAHVTATLEAELASQLREKTKLEAEVQVLRKRCRD